MATSEYLEILKRGTEPWNLWRVSNPLVRPNFEFASLRGAQLSQAYLRDAIFSVAELDEADLSGAILAGARLVGAVLKGSNLQRATLSDANLFQANLNLADLREANLRDANLDQAILRGADLRGADLRRATIRTADLTGANLAGANLGGVSLSGSSLAQADCRGANLSNADLSAVNLRAAALNEATFGWTRLSDVDLSAAKGLESVLHLGPSTAGIDTLFRSGTGVPDSFLQGVGVPDILLTYRASLMGQAFEFFSCSVRCSAEDRRFAERLYADLRAKGVRTWLLPDDPNPTVEQAWREIDQSIKVFDRLVLICSATSLRNDRLLMDLEQALDREEDDDQAVLFPVRVDDYLLDGWRHERKDAVLARAIDDFSGWDRNADKYDAALAELLERLTSAERQDRTRALSGRAS